MSKSKYELITRKIKIVKSCDNNLKIVINELKTLHLENILVLENIYSSIQNNMDLLLSTLIIEKEVLINGIKR